jgi:predicted nucleic acid-binding protein
MIAVDTNILIYAHRQDAPFHQPAARRVIELAEGRATWAIPWPCLHEFLAVVTRQGIYSPPTPLSVALDHVDALLESPTLVLLAESEQHWPDCAPC